MKEHMLKKIKEQMLLLKTVFTFQLSLKTKLPSLLKNISLRKISCKVSSRCLLAHFPHLCFGLLSSPKAFWGAKSARNHLAHGLLHGIHGLTFLSECHEAIGRDSVARYFVAEGCWHRWLQAVEMLHLWHGQQQQSWHGPQWRHNGDTVLACLLETREGVVFSGCYY